MRLEQGEHFGGDDVIGTSGNGVDQSGNSNSLNLFQLAGANAIGEVQQHGSGNIASVVLSGGGSIA